MGKFGGQDGKDGDVLEFGGRPRQNMHPVLQKVEAYWESQRKGRIVPSRSDIDPIGLEGVLANVFIVERISKGLARFRIAGTHMNELIGLDVRGMPVSAVFNSENRSTLAEGLEEVFDHPAVLHLGLESTASFGRTRLDGEMLFLPLRSDLGEVSRAVGVVIMQGSIGRTPRRLGIVRETRRGLTGFGGAEAAQHSRFEDAQASVPTQRPGPPRKTLSQHLRLVADNTTFET